LSLFVSFEGGEGSGKTAQARLLADRLRQAGVQVLPVHEPGMTKLGERLRGWLKSEARESISPGAEVFMFAAARAELVARTLRPALDRPGLVVVADRYADSTTAYQGYGRRLSLKDVEAVNRLATQGIMPDVTFLLDCPPEEGLRRTGTQASMALDSAGPRGPGRIDDEGTRRFERESLSFHRRVRDGYLKMARREPQRWQVIDATGPVEVIGEIVWARVQKLIAIREHG